jgi:uncharacterized membrane protein
MYWTEAAGRVFLMPSDPDARFVRGEANGASAQGEYTTGWIAYDIGTTGDRVGDTAYRWSPTEETLLMSSYHGDEIGRSIGWEITADGSVIVGEMSLRPDGSDEARETAFLWDVEGGGVLSLDAHPGRGWSSQALDVTDDASVVVGRSSEGAFIWDEPNGMRLLHDFLVAEYGLDLAGWTLEDVRGISADGTVLAGNGINPEGIQEGWVAVIPEPSTGLLVGLGLVGMGRRRSGVAA